jgi:hypothetical protein
MEEDLQRGRFNYAARRLLAGSPLDPVTASPRIVRELVLGDGVPRIVTDVRDRVRRASAALGSIEGAIPREQVAAALRAVDQLERQLYREGAEVFFRSLSEGRGAAART